MTSLTNQSVTWNTSLSESWGEGYFQVRGSVLQSFPCDLKASPCSDILTHLVPSDEDAGFALVVPFLVLSATTYSTKCSQVSVMMENHCTLNPQDLDTTETSRAGQCLCWCAARDYPLSRNICKTSIQHLQWRWNDVQRRAMNVLSTRFHHSVLTNHMTSLQGLIWKVLYCNVRRLFNFSHRRLNYLLWLKIESIWQQKATGLLSY